MKSRPSLFWMTVASITAAAVYFVAPWDTAVAADQTPAVSAASVSAPVAPPMATPPPAPVLPYGVGEVLKMYQGGISKDVIINYINNTALPYHLTADGIIHLQSLGVPQEITRTIIQRDGQLQQQAAQQYYQQQAIAAAAAGAQNGAATAMPGQPMPGQPPPDQSAQVVTPTTPPPSVSYIGSDYPYTYPYPYLL